MCTWQCRTFCPCSGSSSCGCCTRPASNCVWVAHNASHPHLVGQWGAVANMHRCATIAGISCLSRFKVLAHMSCLVQFVCCVTDAHVQSVARAAAMVPVDVVVSGGPLLDQGCHRQHVSACVSSTFSFIAEVSAGLSGTLTASSRKAALPLRADGGLTSGLASQATTTVRHSLCIEPRRTCLLALLCWRLKRRKDADRGGNARVHSGQLRCSCQLGLARYRCGLINRMAFVDWCCARKKRSDHAVCTLI